MSERLSEPLGARPSSAACASAGAAAPRGWHKRGFLPHCDMSRAYQMVTYRLADALPVHLAQRLASELADHYGESRYRQRIESILDATHGECVLRRPEIARIVIDAWRYFDGVRYDLRAWVVMPDHVHVLVAMRETSLSTIVHGWKSHTARMINRAVGRSGKVWQEDYWDRLVRDPEHYAAAVAYILANPGGLKTSPAWSRDHSANAAEDGRAPRNAAENGRAPRAPTTGLP